MRSREPHRSRKRGQNVRDEMTHQDVIRYIYTPKTGRALYTVESPPMLIDTFLPACALGGLSGGPGIGKSWLALEAARALATGTPFLGHFCVSKRTPVLLIGSDSSEYDYARQWRRLTAKQYEELGGEQIESDPEDPTREVGGLNPLNDCFRHLIETDFSLDDPDKVDAMIRAVNFEWGPYEWVEEHEGEDEDGLPYHIDGEWMRNRGAGLIIMDTFGSLTDKDLIDNTQMIAVYKGLRRFVTAAGATVLLLNHNPHGRETWLGAISQVGKLDFWLHLRRPHKWDETFIQVVFKKVRGIRPNRAIYYRMNVDDANEASLVSETNDRGETPISANHGEGAVEPLDPDRTLVLGLVRSGSKMMKDFVNAEQASPTPSASPDIARRRLARLLSKMVLFGEVAVDPAPGKPSIWSLPSTNGPPVGLVTK